MDQIKPLAKGHSGIIQRLDRNEEENKHEHLETCAVIKISFSQLDKQISDLESQMKEVQEWKKRFRQDCKFNIFPLINSPFYSKQLL